jgi:hypothetical protein
VCSLSLSPSLIFLFCDINLYSIVTLLFISLSFLVGWFRLVGLV